MKSIKDKIRNTKILLFATDYVDLTKKGTNWVGLCPFHDEKTPSFYVSEKRNSFKCFGCGKGGDVINFIQEIKGITFKEALMEIGIDSKKEREKKLVTQSPPLPKKLHLIDPKYLRQSLKGYKNNCFVNYLNTLFDTDLVKELTTKMYHIGTSKSIWDGATVFWQVDRNLQIRQAKAILYNPQNGKRRKWKRETDHPFLEKAKENWIVKNKVDAISFGKRLIKKSGISEPSIIPCFFGEHLVKDNQKIAIVESEKTAILMAGFGRIGLPVARDYIWLATGGANGISFRNKAVFKFLDGKDIVLFPDLEKFFDWTLDSFLLENTNVKVSDMLERIATDEDRIAGLDIADFILREYEKGFNYQSTKRELSQEKEAINSIPKIISKSEQVFQMMKTKNPAITELIKVFDIDIKKMTVKPLLKNEL